MSREGHLSIHTHTHIHAALALWPNTDCIGAAGMRSVNTIFEDFQEARLDKYPRVADGVRARLPHTAS